MLNAILSRWARTRGASSTSSSSSPTTLDRSTQAAPTRTTADTLWQSIRRWIPGEPDPRAGMAPRQQALVNNVPAARAEFEASLAGLHGEGADILLRKIRRSRDLADLWHLRTSLYNEVARTFSQREAEQRLALLHEHFTAANGLATKPTRRH